MSALGHKRTFRSAIAMSALPPKADLGRDGWACPLCAISGHRALFDHLGGASDQRGWYNEAERLSGDDGLILGRRLHWQISRFFALENAIDVAGCEPVLVDQVSPIGDESTGSDEDTIQIDRGSFLGRTATFSKAHTFVIQIPFCREFHDAIFQTGNLIDWRITCEC